ncbi:MAG: hypothetical protein ABIE94_00900 [archaeon]
MFSWKTVLVGFVLSLPFVSAMQNPWENFNIQDSFEYIYDFLGPLFADPKSRTIIVGIFILIILNKTINIALARTPIGGSKKISFPLAFVSTLALMFSPKTGDFMMNNSMTILWLFAVFIIIMAIEKFFGGFNLGGSYGKVRRVDRAREKIAARAHDDEKKEEKEEDNALENVRDEEHEEMGELRGAKHAMKVLKKLKKLVLEMIEAFEKHEDIKSKEHIAKEIEKKWPLLVKYCAKIIKKLQNERQDLERELLDVKLEEVLDEDEERLKEKDQKLEEEAAHYSELVGHFQSQEEERIKDAETKLESKEHYDERFARITEEDKKLLVYLGRMAYEFLKIIVEMGDIAKQAERQLIPGYYKKLLEGIDHLMPMLEKEERIIKRRKHMNQIKENLMILIEKATESVKKDTRSEDDMVLKDEEEAKKAKKADKEAKEAGESGH